nr:MAG TPA: hypothetical protein [Caudoviricetes sp.]
MKRYRFGNDFIKLGIIPELYIIFAYSRNHF